MMIDKRMAGSRTVLLIALLLLTFGTTQARPDSYRIDLPTRTFFPQDDNASWFDERPTHSPGSTILIQFDHHPDTDAKRALARKGVVLQFYIGGGTWVAWADKKATSKELTPHAPRWAGPLEAHDRINPVVLSDEVPTWAVAEDESRLYAVRFVSTLPEYAAEILLQTVAEEVGDYVEPFRTWYIRAMPDVPEQLAQMQEVLYVDYIAMPLSVSNASVRATMFVNDVQTAPYNLDGTGITACVYDGGLVDVSHPDFGGRVTLGESGRVENHPTHVAGTLGGAGGVGERGMAPAVNILSYSYEDCDPFCLYNSPQDIWENYTEAVTLGGARLITNSIGANVAANGYSCSWLGDYELTSALLDSAIRGGVGSEVIVLFAAGNERIDGSPCGISYNTMSIPAGAKNVITVGAFQDNGSIASFSSFGPTDDGRIKPEVTGNGVNVLSTVPGGGYGTMSGTSMSTPATAGVTALLLEAWDRHPGLPAPTPAQVKAVLVTGADDAGLSGPDYQFGFGRVNARKTVDIVNRYGFTAGEVEDDGEWTHTFEVGPDGADLKVSIAWSDPPAAPLAATTLVNDLDLTLISPNGSTFNPFLLDGANPGTPATTGRNQVDVVEQVFVANPMAGTWTIVVQGYDIPFGPQAFGIAATVPLHENVVHVQGVVTDAVSTTPVVGAQVRLVGNPKGATTNASGAYSFYHRLNEDTELVCEAPGFTNQRGYLLAGTAGLEVTRNFALNPGGSVMVNGIVYDGDGIEVSGAEVASLDNPNTATQTDGSGEFSLMLTTGQLHRLRARFNTQAAYQDLFPLPGEEPPLLIFNLIDESQHITGPDGHGYIAIQNGDEHPQAPLYSWVEIDPDEGGPGTRLLLDQDDDTPFEVLLPFRFTFYGVNYDTLTMCENGMFFFGAQGDLENGVAGDFSNSPIPGLDGPPAMVAPFWEDFRANATNFSTWFDETNGLFYLEWFNSRQFPTDGTFETFQVVLYDPTVHTTPTGDGMILFQYADVNDLGNATVGIESPDETDGLQLLFYDADGNGSTVGTIGEIVDGTAILFLRTSASVAGTVTLHPANPDVMIEVRAGDFETVCDEAGSFILAGLTPRLTELRIQAPGYENLTLAVDLTTPLPEPLLVELYALQPPTGVTGETLEQGFQVSWVAPEQPTVSFEERYRLYRDGEQLLELEQTEWLDPGPFTLESVYWVTAVYSGGESDTSAHVSPGNISNLGEEALPLRFEVSSAWPNPFNPSTSIRVALPSTGTLRVEVVDLLGRRVAVLADLPHASAGNHRLTWNASGHASGLYFVRVQTGEHQAVRKVMLLK